MVGSRSGSWVRSAGHMQCLGLQPFQPGHPQNTEDFSASANSQTHLANQQGSAAGFLRLERCCQAQAHAAWDRLQPMRASVRSSFIHLPSAKEFLILVLSRMGALKCLPFSRSSRTWSLQDCNVCRVGASGNLLCAASDCSEYWIPCYKLQKADSLLLFTPH